MTSEEFSKKLYKSNEKTFLVIGGAFGLSEEIKKPEKRTWLQKSLIISGVVLGLLIIAASIRLSSFEDAVESIVRIEVPAGVLAELPAVSKNEILGSAIQKLKISSTQKSS